MEIYIRWQKLIPSHDSQSVLQVTFHQSPTTSHLLRSPYIFTFLKQKNSVYFFLISPNLQVFLVTYSLKVTWTKVIKNHTTWLFLKEILDWEDQLKKVKYLYAQQFSYNLRTAYWHYYNKLTFQRSCNRYRFTDDNLPWGVDMEFCSATACCQIHTFCNIFHVPSHLSKRMSSLSVKVNLV